MIGVPEESGPSSLLFAARKEHYTLPGLVLSALARQGTTMSDAAQGELDRARRRGLWFDDILTRVSADVSVRPIKGPVVARYYPADLLRPQGDLDLLVDNERDAWRVARMLSAIEPVYIGVSVLGAPTRHLLVTMTWTPEDALLDPEMRVEITTAALTGDEYAVPIRSALPDEPLLACLLALSEERFQRPFHARDAIDVHLMGGSNLPMSVAEMAAAIGDYCLAPEVAELLAYTAARAPLGSFTGLGEELQTAVTAELARRATYPGTATRTLDVLAALADGSPLYGMPLRRITNGRDDWDSVRTHCFGDEALLLTPVGDYLLVAEERVDPDRYDAAVRELQLCYPLAQESV
ncbi:nucleotidyltransferase family protein [Nocardia terpenica]|uniref:hypothetical protein n=1 Tax=Nocardia terpenica TaxID=455432 RepID=UPI002FE0368D